MKRGEISVGIMLTVMISIIVGVALLSGGGVSSGVGELTQTYTLANQTLTAASVAGGNITLAGRELVGSIIVINTTGGQVVTSNFTTFNNKLVNGERVLQLQVNGAPHLGQPVSASYTYEGKGYVDESGTRALTSLILVFAALAVALIAFIPVFQSGILDKFS